ncbi:MAG: OmpA family protein, partial [Alphaproteobacteria bacterium]|nr:OmpA family protein [Alphaproteobacteria bacterium]
AQWAQAVETGMRALQELGSGSVTFSDGDVSLIATQGTSEALFDKVVGELEADLPPTFTLHSILPEPEVAETENARPEFTVTRSPEGQTQLRGRIADERSKLATEALARAAFGAQSVYSAMRVDDSLPEGWSVRAMAAIEALSQLSQGAVTMTANTVDVRGQTGDPNAKAAIAGLLSEKLGEGQNFNISVDYIRKLDPVLNLPTPADCVANANQILAASKIVFDPGSTELNAAANETVDRIAETLKDCENVDMEIGAYSDSQGGEEMNLNLSAQRANAVLDGLLMRRVAGVSFTAKGYGEANPIGDNETEEGREANRRIEFKLIGDEAAEAPTEGADATDETPEAAPDDAPTDETVGEAQADTTDDTADDTADGTTE